MSHVVAGIFNDETAASKAVAGLVDSHFDTKDITIIAAHRREHEEVPVVDWISSPVTLVIGLVGGACFGAVALMLAATGRIPGWTPELSQAGAALQGVWIGAAVGALAGGLFGLGIHRFSAGFGSAHVHDGAVWVGVNAAGDAVPRARDALKLAGARHFVERDES